MNWRCRIFGHKRYYYPHDVLRHSRRGYMYLSKREYVTCSRCYCGLDAYNPGWTEHIAEKWRRMIDAIENTKETPRAIDWDDDIPF